MRIRLRDAVFEIRRSSIDGKGLFTKRRIQARKKLGEMTGELISQREAVRRVRNRQRIAIVEFGNGKAIDASTRGNYFRYANHSCTPNAFVRIFRGHIEFYAIRNIKPGEEITCNYGNTHHNGNLRCNCGSRRCRGYL